MKGLNNKQNDYIELPFFLSFSIVNFLSFEEALVVFFGIWVPLAFAFAGSRVVSIGPIVDEVEACLLVVSAFGFWITIGGFIPIFRRIILIHLLGGSAFSQLFRNFSRSDQGVHILVSHFV